MKYLIENRKIATFIVTMQEAFSAIIPFVLLSSFIMLLTLFVEHYHILSIDNHTIAITRSVANSSISIIVSISIAYFFAQRIKTSSIVASILSITVLISIALYEYFNGENVMLQGLNISAIIAPMLSAYFLKLYYPKLSLGISVVDGNYHVYKYFNYIFIFFAAFVSTIIVYILFDTISENIISNLSKELFDNFSDTILYALRVLLKQLFWFFGLHGDHMVNALFGKDIIFQNLYPNLTLAEFYRLYVAIGGDGAGVAMLMPLLFFIKNRDINLITKISIPFVFFNINTLLIYAVIVLNRYLILPFILVPLVNFFIAYLAIGFMHLHFTSFYLSWMTPVYFDSFLKVQEYHLSMALQTFLLIIDVSIYGYFIRQFASFQSLASYSAILSKNLEITQEIKSKMGLTPFAKRQEIIEANAEVDKIVHSLNEDSIFIYYQPKVSISDQKCNQFEALIRYYHDGKLTGPIFLDTLEKAGLAPIIDLYVCKIVKKDLSVWSSNGLKPKISINLHPDTLNNSEVVFEIIKLFENENIMFEIIERTFLEKRSQENIALLKDNGFKVSIDDFGSGYSSFESIIKYQIDEVKIDKSIIDYIDTKKAYLTCKHIASLCNDIGISVVAEGVETEKQVEIVRSIDIDIIQGYYFSKATPLNEAIKYAKSKISL